MDEILTKLAFTVSGIFMFLGAFGLFRFKNFYVKVHCATMVSVGGVMFSLVLLLIHAADSVMKLKILALLLILFITMPVSTHFIALAAYKRGVKV